MDAAAKAAQEEARNKAKSNRKPSSESAGKVDPATEEEQKKEAEPPRTPGLFDHPAEPQTAPKPARVAPVAAAATLVLAAPKEGLHNDQLATSSGLLIVLSEKVAKGPHGMKSDSG
jgi:hypothetical protein